MLRFYIHRVLGMIKSREKYARGGNEFSPSCSFVLSRFWNLTSASHKAKSYLCLLTALYWMGARGKAESRAARDRNILFHTSELFGWKSKLKGGKTLHWKKSTQENLAHCRFRKSIWPIEMKIKVGCRLNFWSLKTLGSTSENTLAQKSKETETAWHQLKNSDCSSSGLDFYVSLLILFLLSVLLVKNGSNKITKENALTVSHSAANWNRSPLGISAFSWQFQFRRIATSKRIV